MLIDDQKEQEKKVLISQMNSLVTLCITRTIYGQLLMILLQ